MALPLCPNCHRPARYVDVYADGSEVPSCGRCHQGAPVTVREIGTGDEFAPRPAAAALPEWSTVAEVAARHRCAPKTIRAEIRAGRLAFRDGPPRPYKIHRDAEREWIEQRQTGQRKTAAKTKTPKRGERRSTFSDLARKS